jgi:hypothetical protein
MNKLLIPDATKKKIQPLKCQGYIWGNWDGLMQYCSKIKCIKE